MRLETGIIVFKGLAHVLIGAGTPWASSLAQWANSGTWPDKIVWVGVIIPASVIGGASGLLAFLSGSFQEYTKKRDDENTGWRKQAVAAEAAKTQQS